MQHARRPFASWLFVSGPLLFTLLAGCDTQSPAFVEKTTPYSSEDAVGTAYSGSDSLDPSSDTGNAYDPARDDETPADKNEASNGGSGAGNGSGGDGGSGGGASGSGGSGASPSLAIAKWNFKSSKIEKGSLTLDSGFGAIEQALQMNSNRIDSQIRFDQINRPVATETFAQGSELADKSESFQQTAAATGLLDILVVIDNSGSMAEEQVNLSSKMAPLLSFVQNSDWKIGVVTTDPNDGCLRGLIKKGEAQASQKFAQAVNAGTQGSGNERGILQAVNGLKGECNASGSWLRSNSTVAVLIVSDEDNCSNGTGCGTDPWAKSDYLLDYMSQIRQVGLNARVYGLGWHPSKPQTACRTASYKANIYADAVTRSGGTWGSVCDADYSATLSAISLDLSIILKTQFALQATPNGGTMKVYVNDQLQSSGYQLRGNVLEFTPAPAAGANIRVDYKVTTMEPKKEFALSSAADARTLQVYIDGNATQAYTYDSVSKSLRFATAPLGNEIKAVYRKDQALATSFALSGQVIPSSIRVAVAGQALNSSAFSWNASLGKVVLNQAPMDGLSIDVSYTEEVAPKLRYGVNVPESQRSRIRVVDASTGLNMTFTVVGREVVFPMSEYAPLRNVIVRYPVGADAWLVDLGYPVMVESVKVRGTQTGSCAAVRVRGTEVDLSQCTFAADEGIAISFDYAGEQDTSFDLGSLDLDLSQYRWKVMVNGQLFTDYVIANQKIEFPELPLFADVEVTLYKR